MNDTRDRIAAFYRFLWPFLAEEEAHARWLDADPGGRPVTDFLPEIPKRHGLGAGSTILDLGCGKGRQSVAFARLGCRVIAVDPLDENLDLARKRFNEEGVADAVALKRGTIEHLPVDTAGVDFVWCRDVLNHIDALDDGAAECARVLRPGGKMLNYSTLGTSWLQRAELDRLCGPLGMNPETFSAERVREAFARAGLRVVEFATTSEEGSPCLEAIDEHGGRDAMRLARILRSPSRAASHVGAENYDRLVGYYLWNVYLLIDKLTYGVWVFERDGGAPSSPSPSPSPSGKA